MKPKTAGRLGGVNRTAIPFELAQDIPNPGARNAFAGITSGAKIMTMRGLRRIEALKPGDRIVTRSAGAVPVTRIERRSFLSRAVYILAGSIGHHQKDRDTLLPASQCVLLRDWRASVLTGKPAALLPALSLVDGEFIRDLGVMPLSVIRVFCAAPQVIYADGMELGTADAIPSEVRTAA